jgi:hypothetical protein
MRAVSVLRFRVIPVAIVVSTVAAIQSVSSFVEMLYYWRISRFVNRLRFSAISLPKAFPWTVR